VMGSRNIGPLKEDRILAGNTGVRKAAAHLGELAAKGEKEAK